MNNNEFKIKKFKETTVYTLESASVVGTSSIADVSKPIGSVQRRRGDNFFTPEDADPIKPRRGPLRPQTGGGSHKDKSKTIPRKEKHRKPIDMSEDEYGQYENGEMDQPEAVARMFVRLARRGIDPIDIIVDRFGWGTEELDNLAQQHGFEDSAEWLMSFDQDVAEGFSDSSKDYGTDEVTITFDGDIPSKEEIIQYCKKNYGFIPSSIDIEPPSNYKGLENPGIIRVKQGMAEGDEYNEYSDEVDMVENNLHTIIRACKALAETMQSGENLPEWVEEKVSMSKQNMVTVAEYLQSQHEQGHVYDEDHSTANDGWGKASKGAIYRSGELAGAGHDDRMMEDGYISELYSRLGEKLAKNAPVKTYIDDFAKAAKTPNAKGHHQFKNKSPEKVRRMAIAASYAAKNPSKKK